MPGLNAAGEALIKQYEGLSLAPYLDGNNVPTIGYGRTKGVTMTMPPITQEQAEQFFLQDTHAACTDVLNYVAASVPLNDNQFSALVSLVYNCGTLPLIQTMGHKLRARDYVGAAEEFAKWHFDNGKSVDGLVNRRAAEKALFMAQ